jgi:NAD(P)-dependent dehydrogenase (short-subunit alcohol dehydrogenase family)
MVELALSKFGRIDILVNNAGITLELMPLIETAEDDWEKIIAINLTGPFLSSKAVARSMIERGGGGKIINISSRAGKQGIAGLGAYSASKFGLIGLTQVLALELAPYKINVNAICPGQIITDIAREDYPRLTWEEIKQKVVAEHISHIPLGRIGTPEDVANVAAFLASNEADYMTGQSINVTGGRRMD